MDTLFLLSTKTKKKKLTYYVHFLKMKLFFSGPVRS